MTFSLVWMLQTAHFVPKSVLSASFVEGDTEVSPLDSASTARACVRTCWARVGAFQSQQQSLLSLFPLFALRLSVTHLSKANGCVGEKNTFWKFGRQKEKIEEERSEGTEAPSRFWKQPKLYAVETSRKHHKEFRVCSRSVWYLTVDGSGRPRYVGILDVHGLWRRVRQKQGFAVKGHKFAHCENKHVHRYRYI